jgi:hypothetical protein
VPYRAITTRSSLFELSNDSEMIASISLQDFHDVCYLHLFRLHRISVPPNVPVTLGPIRRFCGSLRYEDSSEIAVFPDSGVCDEGWSMRGPVVEDSWNVYFNPRHSGCVALITTTNGRLNCREGTSIMRNGWIRCAFSSCNLLRLPDYGHKRQCEFCRCRR